MRILLASNASYAPPRGGSTHGNLAWLRYLASQGHACRVAGGSIDAQDRETEQDGISIRCAHDLTRRPRIVGDEIENSKPDWVLVSSEDLSHTLLREAAQAAPDRIVYLAHTPQFWPFGPHSWNPDRRGLELVRRARAVVTIGRHMAEYASRHGGVKPHVIHPPIYGRPPWPRYSNYDAEWLLMVNPCQVKGIEIFRGLAKRLRRQQFAGLIGWGTTTADKESLGALANVRLLASVPSIDEVLSRTRILLMPSLWYEGFGLIAMEAMLRGIPVISSDSGGLIEAKDGTGYIIPVKPIERYLPEFDEVHMPKPVVAEQDLTPWVEAIERLSTDRGEYNAESERSRAAAERFISSLRAADFEEMLLSLTPAPETKPEPQNAPDRFERLSPEQRDLLLKRLRLRGHH
jgi:glycosyltransferase involved in cell wall biosynthesis